MAPAQSRPELLVIVGETAGGKSELAMRAAKEFNGEIIAADSWTVYKGFDIGTSKPDSSDRKSVRHWLIDVREPDQRFNAPLFKEMAEAAIEDIQARGKLPILAGGTGLYIDSLLYDFGFLPDSEEREELDKKSLDELLGLARQRKIDLSGIDSRNKRRVVRAIEAKGQKPTKKGLRPGVLMVGLKVGAEELRRRVEQRTDRMIKNGLEQEARQLADRYGWDIEPMKGIGYREWRNCFEGRQTLEETKARIISATMNLAKRQRTWFKRNPAIRWFESTDIAHSYLTKEL